MRVRKSKMTDPRWQPPKQEVVNPDVIADCHGNQFKSYDVRHHDQDSRQVSSMYLELEQRYLQTRFLHLISIN